MATRTKRLGVEGVVIDGRLRDVQYIRTLQLPVCIFPDHLCIILIPIRPLPVVFQSLERGLNVVQGSKTYLICANSSSEIDVPVRLNGLERDIWLTPGDIIIGDADGVVCLPRDLAPKVLELLPRLVLGIDPFVSRSHLSGCKSPGRSVEWSLNRGCFPKASRQCLDSCKRVEFSMMRLV